jgi:hypothetical protein
MAALLTEPPELEERCEHEASPAAEYWPLEQLVHEDAPVASAKVPDAQLLQPAWPAVPWYWPVGHAWHEARVPVEPK